MSTSARRLRSFVYLASASPRRRELLSQIGVSVKLIEAGVDETHRAGEPADAYVTRLALAKARDGRARITSRRAPVVAADTAVVVAGEILGKPASAKDGSRMLERLSGAVHEVFSAVAVISPDRESIAVNRSEVEFRRISAAEIRAYWRTGEPRDKAGGYGIQGIGAIFVREIRGSYSGVMGLPLFETAGLLLEHGIPVLPAIRETG